MNDLVIERGVDVHVPSPAKKDVTDLHLYESRDGIHLGVVRRNHRQRSYEFVVFARRDGQLCTVREATGISDRHAACSQLIDALSPGSSLRAHRT